MTPSAATARWRFAWLYAAPHRMAFAAGALMLAASALWWAVAMLAQSGGHALRFGLPPVQAHGLVMALGFMPLFFTGFLFTAGPKWLGHPPVAARELAAPLFAQLAGWAVFLLGVHGPDPAFGAVMGGLGLAAVAFGWTQVWWRFVAMLHASAVPDRTHARVIAFAGAVGALSLWAAAAGIALSDLALVRVAIHAALWLFIGVVYAAVAHRMIPFFSAAALPLLDAWRPLWLLVSLVGLFAAEGVFAVCEAWAGPLPLRWRAVQAAVELPAGAALLALSIRWGLVQSLRIRLLAMLHLGYVWLGLSFVLAGLSHALAAGSDGSLNLGVAPLHAYTMGFLGSTLIAMVTRVSSGHGGAHARCGRHRLAAVLGVASRGADTRHRRDSCRRRHRRRHVLDRRCRCRLVRGLRGLGAALRPLVRHPASRRPPGLTRRQLTNHTSMTTPCPAPELVCLAGSLRALKLAIDAGADAVYLGLRNATNARNFAGLNFDDVQLREGVACAHARGRKVLMALNTYARSSDPMPWYAASAAFACRPRRSASATSSTPSTA